MTRALALLVAVLSVAACGPAGNNNDQGVGQVCSPGALECVSDSLARVCPADGMGWLGVPCPAGSKCSNGLCVNDTSMCKPGTGSCSGGTAMRCMDNGMGYVTATCPAGTQCVEGGLCKGTCAIGASTCLDPTTVSVCADGNSTVPAACPSGQFCVDTTTDPNFPQAACKTGGCTPLAGACNSICGNMNDATADQTKFVSSCVATPTGYQWQANKCLAPKTCSPTGGSSCASGYGAACTSQCNPGDIRCTSDGLSTQTCTANGTWGPAAGCDATKGQRCVSNAIGSQAACGDPACAFAPGTCDTSGNFHPCVGGKVSSSGAPCATGVCARTYYISNQNFGGLLPGACLAQCKAGDRRCMPGTSDFASCVNGVWGMPTGSCAGEAGANNCFNTTTTSGRPDIVCGVCKPGIHQCASTDAGSSGGLQTCDDSGQWGMTTECAMGNCQSYLNSSSRNFDAACVASCVPGAKLCNGGWFYIPGTNIGGFNTQESVCQPNGTPGTFNPCPSGQGCRRDVGGNPIGCVQCVGSTKNEFGLIDTTCGSVVGVPGSGSAAVLTCKPDNTWDTNTKACGTTTCQSPTGNAYNSVGFLAPPVGAYCHRCYTGNGQTVCSESNMLAGYGYSCAAGNRGAPVLCPSPIAGQPDVADCCGNLCFADPVPSPAYCGPPGGGGGGCGCGCGSGI